MGIYLNKRKRLSSSGRRLVLLVLVRLVNRFTLLNIAIPLSKDTATDLIVNDNEVGIFDAVDVPGEDLLAVGVGFDGSGVEVEDVDLFEGKTLGLRNEEEGEDETPQASATPDEEHLGTEVGIAFTRVDEVGSGEGDRPVHEPVASSRESDTLGTDVKREDFTNDDPSDRSPGGGEESDVNAH